MAIILLVLMQRKRYLSVLFFFGTVLSIVTLLTYILWHYHIYLSIGYFIVPLSSYLFVLSLLMFFIDYRIKKKFIEEIKKASEQKRQLKNELNRSEHEVEYQKAMLFQQSKLAAMGEMIDNIAHQWRQPLNMLGVIIQDLEYNYKSGKIDQKYLHSTTTDSMEQILFMSQTIEDFRNFVKPDQKNGPFDLNHSIEQALHLLSGMFKTHNIHVDISYSDLPITIVGSESEFKQVIINILHNARDALIENNIISPTIVIRIIEDTTHVSVTFYDNGGGISSEIIERIFEPYFTTKEEGKGSGIGLYIAYSIIRMKMGGRINVSNIEDGTLFTITLPLMKDTFSSDYQEQSLSNGK
jgi:signal transduction histidine kinase